MSDPSPVSFDHCDTTRTCPACGETLKSYDTDHLRVLACLGCAWAMANDRVPNGGLWLPKLGDDRQEHARLADAFRECDKGTRHDT